MANTATHLHDEVLSLAYPQEGVLRVRKVISRSKARPTGKYPSWKMGRMIHWESIHELNAYRLLDCDPAVISFHEQPLTIHFILNGERHRHYPDVLVNYGATRDLWEIKPASYLADSEVISRTSLLQDELPKLGFGYRVVVGELLAKEPRLSNVLILLRHGRYPVTILEREQVRKLLLSDSAISWGRAMEIFGADRSRLLSRLYLEGVLTCNIDEMLNSETRFWKV